MPPRNTVACYQMCLPFGQNEGSLQVILSRLLNRPVALTLTDNSTRLLSVNERTVPIKVRLHKMFLAAGEDVLREIAEYIGARRDKTPQFWQFVRENRSTLKQAPRREERMRTRGKVHDLHEIFKSVGAEYFGDALACKITWGRQSKAHGVRHRTLGSYTLETDTVRINPVLDRRSVPRYYLEFIVYHEMLHAQLYREQAASAGIIAQPGGRRVVHSAEFKRRERLFRQYDRAIAFERGGL